MDTYLLVKTLHILSSAILFGTGIGIAFFMFRIRAASNIHEKHYAAKNTVLADFLFTLPAVIIQPLTGIWLVSNTGYDWSTTWLTASLALYLLIGLCWIPVVWIQIQLRKMIRQSVESDSALPVRFDRLFRLWFILGWPAFMAIIVIFYLMVAKPS